MRSLFIIDERCKPIKEKVITLEDVVRNEDLMLDIIHKFAKQEGLFEDIGLPAKEFYDLLKLTVRSFFRGYGELSLIFRLFWKL